MSLSIRFASGYPVVCLRKRRLALSALCIASVIGIAGAQTEFNDEELDALRQSYNSKQWTFVDERSGDCHMSGVLTIFSNGRAIWMSTTSTDSTNFADIWHVSFKVFNTQDQRLFGFGVWDSPGMRADGNQYFWKKTGEFPKALFDTAEKASADSSC